MRIFQEKDGKVHKIIKVEYRTPTWIFHPPDISIGHWRATGLGPGNSRQNKSLGCCSIFSVHQVLVLLDVVASLCRIYGNGFDHRRPNRMINRCPLFTRLESSSSISPQSFSRYQFCQNNFNFVRLKTTFTDSSSIIKDPGNVLQIRGFVLNKNRI